MNWLAFVINKLRSRFIHQVRLFAAHAIRAFGAGAPRLTKTPLIAARAAI